MRHKNKFQEKCRFWVLLSMCLILLSGTTCVMAASVLTPTSPGNDVFSAGDATVDVSNASEGYITAAYSGSSPKAKIRITCGGLTYTYNLRVDGTYEVFPLTRGNGSYQIAVFNNVVGESYAQALSETIQVTLRDQTLPFLYPNQFVNFNASSLAVAKADELAQTAGDELGVVSSVYNYVVANVQYDTAKAQMVMQGQLAGYVPTIDQILLSGKGICFDYAALMSSMLRSQGIPTRMEVGYVSGGIYHAWISTYIKEIGWVNGIIQFDGTNWKIMDPTFASNGQSSPEIMSFIGNGGNYQTMYVY